MEIRLRLDDEVDKTTIAEIKKVAGNGPLSKALYRIVLEWQILKEIGFVPKSAGFAADPGGFTSDQGQNENNLADVLSAIEKEW